MGSSAVIPPPPPGFTLIDDNDQVPPPPPGFTPIPEGQSHIRTPKETEDVLRSRYPQAYQDTPSVTRQVLTGAAKRVGEGLVGPLGGAIGAGAQAASAIQRLRGKPDPLAPLQPQGPGEEAGGLLTDAASMIPGLLPGKVVKSGVEAIQGFREGRALDKAVRAEKLRQTAKGVVNGPRPGPPPRVVKETPGAVPTWNSKAPTGIPPSPVEPPVPEPAARGTIPTWKQDPVVRPPIETVPSTNRPGAPPPVEVPPAKPTPGPSTQRTPGPVELPPEEIIPARPSTQRRPGPVATPVAKPAGPVSWRGSTSYQPENVKTTTPAASTTPAPAGEPPVKPDAGQAASALAEELGGEPGKPLVIQPTGEAAAAEAKTTAILKNVVARMQAEGLTPAAIEEAKNSLTSRGIDTTILDDTLAEFRKGTTKFALGGVVAGQKGKVRTSKRGVVYGPPKLLRQLKKSKLY